MTAVTVGESKTKVTFSNSAPLALIAGSCVIESEQHVLWLADALQSLSGAYVFKASFDKANRSSVHSFRGPGLQEGVRILRKVREYGLPVLTDIHAPDQAQIAAEGADILQIPAFLCRQTDLLLEAGKTGRAVNIKKGQFVSPYDIAKAAEKVASTGNDQILLTERGSSFGYNNLIVDMRGLEIMKSTGYPVIFDATHSVQLPGAGVVVSGGQPEFIEPLARAATAIGIAGLFLEVHEEPQRALSDGAIALKLERLPTLLEKLRAIDSLVKGFATEESKRIQKV